MRYSYVLLQLGRPRKLETSRIRNLDQEVRAEMRIIDVLRYLPFI